MFRNKVFLFGTGRCGSTFLQRLITVNSRVWVWGEHNGILRFYQRAATAPSEDKHLAKMMVNTLSAEQMIDLLVKDSPRLAWICGFEVDAIQQNFKALLHEMFGAKVPAGWDDWGFKEILYGLDDTVPEVLMNLYEDAVPVFAFREPLTTVKSMLVAWDSQTLATAEPKVITHLVNARLNRWKKSVQYFTGLKARVPSRLILCSADKFALPPSKILSTLGLAFVDRFPDAKYNSKMNTSKNVMLESTAQVLAEVFEDNKKEIDELYALAKRRSDEDFAAA